ncbi:sulfite exporter TauE/SafE family protein [Pseudanabaena sp. PCC 6802]|uniref:urease accessory protein UreH domain-containing protein n=1 Tax=Pseudanabaena sp. PCC 6802 TaxID=118173 RepID=UPI00034C809A|nr:sulfite exporter TauE/SafE family protein [Pseudanabaena sp. PCC 6802]
MLDLLLVAALGFLGSFGHCVGMCGPLTVAFSLSGQQESEASRSPQQTTHNWRHYLYFHTTLNLGRILSYALAGMGIGGLGSVLVAGGQLAGIDSSLRQGLAIFTGILLIWLGIAQIDPKLLPRIPLPHPIQNLNLHQKLSTAMVKLSLSSSWWTPGLLGMAWGLIPCGFLYIAQIKAAETGDMLKGAMTMLAFGLGTMPAMVGVGVSASLLSKDKRSQLFRLGGWITLAIGILTLTRTANQTDYTGHASLFLLMLALVARPLANLWSHPLRYRRAIGVGAFVLAIAHTIHMLEHTFNWKLQVLEFMLPTHQCAIWCGLTALILITPAAITSSDWMVQKLGKHWRSLHLLAVPALLLAAIHTIAIGSHYLGSLESTHSGKITSAICGVLVLLVMAVRWRWLWRLVGLEKFYTAPSRSSG